MFATYSIDLSTFLSFNPSIIELINLPIRLPNNLPLIGFNPIFILNILESTNLVKPPNKFPTGANKFLTFSGSYFFKFFSNEENN